MQEIDKKQNDRARVSRGWLVILLCIIAGVLSSGANGEKRFFYSWAPDTVMIARGDSFEWNLMLETDMSLLQYGFSSEVDFTGHPMPPFDTLVASWDSASLLPTHYFQYNSSLNSYGGFALSVDCGQAQVDSGTHIAVKVCGQIRNDADYGFYTLQIPYPPNPCGMNDCDNIHYDVPGDPDYAVFEVSYCTPISGDLSGILGSLGSPYCVVDDITVSTGQTLLIEPGVQLIFDGPHRMYVRGLLSCAGGVGDSIYFTMDTLSSPDGWGGIFFESAHDSCRLEYCVIEHGNADEEGLGGLGGGVYCSYSFPYMEHCSFRSNSAKHFGGAIACENNSRPTVSACFFIGNSAAVGGAIWCDSCSLTLSECTFTDNQASAEFAGGGAICCRGPGSVRISQCFFDGNWAKWGGGGVCWWDASPVLDSCTFHGNSALYGGGVYNDGRSPELNYCLLTANSAGSGGGMYCNGGSPLISHCTFSGDSALWAGGGVCGWNTTPTINSTIIANSSGGEGLALYGSESTGAQIEYCDFHGNAGGDFTGTLPYGLGIIAGVNANGDPCDAFYNIFCDPEFCDPANGDYTIFSGSCCVGAGEGGSDIGAFEIGCGKIEVEDEVAELRRSPRDFFLSQNYPNPFNSHTEIQYGLPKDCKVTLGMYNVLGEKIRTLADGHQEAGYNRAVWDGRTDYGSPVPTGVYFYRICAEDFVQTNRMILLR